MVQSPKTGRELGSERIDKAPSFIRKLLGSHTDAAGDDSDED
jgi:hypothetical protein